MRRWMHWGPSPYIALRSGKTGHSQALINSVGPAALAEERSQSCHLRTLDSAALSQNQSRRHGAEMLEKSPA